MLEQGTRYSPFFLFGSQSNALLDARLRTSYPKWFETGDDRGRKRERKEGIKTIDRECADIDKFWSDLVFEICKGDPGQMRELVKMDIFDFFGFVDRVIKNIKKK